MLAYNELPLHQTNGINGNSNSNSNGNNGGGITAMASKASAPQNIIANAGLSYEDVLNDDFQFDMDGHDVMVFLHIQKTGGTSFGRHLVRDLDLKVSGSQRKFSVLFFFKIFHPLKSSKLKYLLILLNNKSN